MVKILIDASGATTHGSKYHINSLINYFKNNDSEKYILIVITSTNFYTGGNFQNLKVKNFKFLKNIYLRILWSTFFLPFYAFFIKVNKIYSPFDIGPIISLNTKILLGIKNPNLLLPKHLVTLKYPYLHKFVSKISSFSANNYLYPSNYAMNEIGRYYYKNKEKALFIYHGIDFSDWNYIQSKALENKKYIFFCSNLYKFKNIEILLITLFKYNLISPNKFHLIICGNFVNEKYRSEILNIIKNLNLSSFVIFVENQSRSQIVNYYLNAEIIIIPTLYETFGHMYLEAINSFKPVLVADIEIAKEILQNTVHYFRSDSENDLLNFLIDEKYLNNLRTFNDIRKILLEKFTIEKECKLIMNFLYDF